MNKNNIIPAGTTVWHPADSVRRFENRLAKTAILITEFAVQKRHEGLSISEAAIGACRDRLRPIMMTVLTMIMGMIPLILENGAGAVGNKSLALAAVGGMAVGTLALLFVTPAFYIIFQSLHERLTPVKE